jgi:DNA-binding transcriptional MerR regulator
MRIGEASAASGVSANMYEDIALIRTAFRDGHGYRRTTRMT